MPVVTKHALHRQRQEKNKLGKYSLLLYFFENAMLPHNRKRLINAVEEGFQSKMKLEKPFERRKNVFMQLSFKNKEDMEEYKKMKKNNFFFEIAGRSVLNFF